MSRSRVSLLVALAAITLPVTSRTATAAPTNVLLIITDEHNFRTLGCYREWMPREQAEMWGLGAVVPTPNHLRRTWRQ